MKDEVLQRVEAGLAQETAARVKIEDSLPKLERQLMGVEEAVRLDQQTTSRSENYTNKLSKGLKK